MKADIRTSKLCKGSEKMNRDGLGELILHSTDSMYRVAKIILGDDEDCKDAISEAIVHAYEKLHTLQYDNYAKTWLMRILMNECYQLLRKRKPYVVLEECETEAVEPKEDYSELYQALKKLPEKLRVAVALYYIEGYKVKEIAAILHSTQTAVKKRLARGREALKQYLSEDE